MTTSSQWMVVTDLDGTLLNHHTYAYEDALPALAMLQQRAIPIILNTSKTYTETRFLRQELHIDDPFIVENGSCVYLPMEQFLEAPIDTDQYGDYWRLELGLRIEKITPVLDALAKQYRFTRLSQCSIEQVVELTGLSRLAAERAKMREYSEPIIWHEGEPELTMFKQQLEQASMSSIQGGRFLHIQGVCNKGAALKALQGCYRTGTKTIVLGDSKNDADMLAVADVSVIIKSPSNAQLRKFIEPDIYSDLSAPAGWSEAINKALSKIERN